MQNQVKADSLGADTRSIEDRILQAHQLLIEIAAELRGIDDFDHAQDMSNAALFCRAARNELREGQQPAKPVRAMRGRRFKR